MRHGTISHRLDMLSIRIKEKKETNIEDVCLLDEAAEYIRALERDIAVFYDEVVHPKNREEGA